MENINVYLSFIGAFLVSFVTIPSIVRIAKIKNLYDSPIARKSHTTKTPTLGGVALFAGTILNLTFWTMPGDFFHMKYIITAIVLVFFTGIKDDIVNLVAWKKLVAQLVSAFILVYWGDIRITSLYGLLGIYDIPYFASMFLSILTITFITNSVNLIDGIDWLAGGIGLIINLTFGTWFLISGFNSFAVLAYCFAGALLGFLYFNKSPAKIFMGDTGSLLIGIGCSILAIKFIEINKVYHGPYHVSSVPAVAIAILIIPIFDSLRVMLLRILAGKSFLEADKNHIHHKLVENGASHIKASLILFSVNILFIFLAFKFMSLRGEILLVAITLLASALTFLASKFKIV